MFSSDTLFLKFKGYMDFTSQPMRNFTQKRTMKDMLSKFKVIKKQAKVNGSAVWYYWFDVTNVLQHLNNMGLNEEIEDLNENDFE